MANVAVCRKCGALYEASSEEDASAPDCMCADCWADHRAKRQEDHDCSDKLN